MNLGSKAGWGPGSARCDGHCKDLGWLHHVFCVSCSIFLDHSIWCREYVVKTAAVPRVCSSTSVTLRNTFFLAFFSHKTGKDPDCTLDKAVSAAGRCPGWSCCPLDGLWWLITSRFGSKTRFPITIPDSTIFFGKSLKYYITLLNLRGKCESARRVSGWDTDTFDE